MRPSGQTLDQRFVLSNFDFDLPKDQIAIFPPEKRGDSRLLVVDRRQQSFADKQFVDLPSFLDAGDILVRNSSGVLPCRVQLTRPGGSQVEAVLAPFNHPNAEAVKQAQQIFKDGDISAWSVLARNLKVGMRVSFGNLQAFVQQRLKDRSALVFINGSRSLVEAEFDRLGQMPLPPYILNQRGTEKNWPEDRQRYQTVFANEAGSIAAPTAGLHFTDALFDELRASGVGVHDVTLHVGRGTFQPIEAEDIRDHQMAEEFYSVPPSTQDAIAKTKQSNRRVVGVGTTVVRSLESWRRFQRPNGASELFLYPGEQITSIDALITNFHLPSSSLLLLVMAFAGEELVRRAYQHAVDERYRFYSYGDAMLVI